MRYLTEYNSFIDSNDLTLLAESIDLKLYENSEKSSWKQILDNVVKDLGIQLNFVATFGVAITAYLPIINSLITNSNINITKESVVLLVISSLSILFNERKDDIKKINLKIKEQGLFDYLNMVIKSTKSIKDIFKFLTKGIGKTINFTIDMFAYTAMLIPFLDVVHHLISKQNITLQDLIVMGAAVATGVLSLTVKNFIKDLYQRLKFKIQNVFKLQNKNNIEPLRVSTENVGPKN